MAEYERSECAPLRGRPQGSRAAGCQHRGDIAPPKLAGVKPRLCLGDEMLPAGIAAELPHSIGHPRHQLGRHVDFGVLDAPNRYGLARARADGAKVRSPLRCVHRLTAELAGAHLHVANENCLG